MLDLVNLKFEFLFDEFLVSNPRLLSRFSNPQVDPMI